MVSYISEIKLQKELRKVAAISLISIIVLITFAIATFKIVSYVYTSSNADQLEATVTEYGTNLKRKAQSELRTLRTLAMFTKSGSDLVNSYHRVGQENVPFEVVGFWYLDGSCEQISLSGVKTDSSYSALPPQVKLAVSSAWLGHSTVSAPYYSPTIGADMVTYVAPVFSNEGKVIGALSGAVSQKSFDKTLEQLALVNQGVDAFMATSSGQIFSRGLNSVIPSNIKSISDFTGFDQLTLDHIKMGLVSASPMSVECDIADHSYLITITPLGFSNWYLCTLSSNEISSSPYYKSLSMLILSVSVILALCIFIAIYLFFSMKRSYRTQLLIAHYDPITSCYNYPKFILEFEHLDYKSTSSHSYAVVSLNIHDYSYIQEMLGEQQADELLCTIADVLRSQKDSLNIVIFCHHEVDQFYVIIDSNKQNDVDSKVRTLMDTCVSMINSKVSSIPIVMYAGVAFTYPDMTPDKIVARAEFAKKQIIKTYTHAVRFYDENAYKKEAFLHSIEKSMRAALDPNDFIPLFEQNGFCTELDLYMFDKACQKIRYYLDNNINPIYFSINQTKLLIFQKGYTDKLRAILQKYNIPPKYIVIEVLEDLATHNVEELNYHIKELKSLGLSIALDDFGSGYSSLNIVAGLDIDEIKFDREFLMADDPEQIKRNHMILRVLSKLAKEMGIRTVVEGVERNEDVEFLKSIDCDLAQGFYYDRPIPAAAFDLKYMTPEHKASDEPAQLVAQDIGIADIVKQEAKRKQQEQEDALAKKQAEANSNHGTTLNA